MSRTAKIFMHGGSQAVRLPKEFRLPGKEVRVSREGKRVVLEPLGQAREEVETIWAQIDEIRSGQDLFPEAGFEDPPAERDDRVFFRG